MSKPYFNINHYPNTSKCQTLDAQISDLRDKQDLVNRKLMWGNAKTVQDVLMNKYDTDLGDVPVTIYGRAAIIKDED